ncbi:Retinol dehydrogenase 12 [Dictyocoela muelleri]|nr:Retinol dehydrogenase 12 [Dictyocoela muelleri]
MFSIKKYNQSAFIFNGYCQSKLCNTLLAFYFKNSGLNTIAVHPGIINTGLFKGKYKLAIKILNSFIPWCLNTVDEGSDSLINAMFFPHSNEFNILFGTEKIKLPDYVCINESEKMIRESKKYIENLNK